MTDVPTDAFNKWHPDKAAAFPAQAVDIIHYLQDALAQCRDKLEHLVDARNVWGELNWHDAFMESQKERCRLNVEVASLRAEGPSIDLAQAQRRWDEAADEIERLNKLWTQEIEANCEAGETIKALRAEVERLQYEAKVRDSVNKEHRDYLTAEVERLGMALAEGCIDSELVHLRAEVEHAKTQREYDNEQMDRYEEQIETLRAEVERCHARLEIDHYYEGPDMKRVETTMEDRQTFPDGITCRDCTIKLQEEELERLRREIRDLRRELSSMNDLAEITREEAVTPQEWADELAVDEIQWLRLRKAFTDAIAAEREACAEICDETASVETKGTIGWQTCTELAAAIRARKP